MGLKYNRVLIKLSGEAFSGKSGEAGGTTEPLGFVNIKEYAKTLVELSKEGLQIGIVVGGGNIYRGRKDEMQNRVDGDHLGMLATAINSLALADAIRAAGGKCSVMSALPMERICDTYSQRKALEKIEQGEILLFACGFGSPYFSTDTASVIRAIEMNADVLVCGKNIDGIYNHDPKLDAELGQSVFLPRVSYRRALVDEHIKALDKTAVTLGEEHKLRIIFFKFEDPGRLIDAMHGRLERCSYIGPEVSTDDDIS